MSEIFKEGVVLKLFSRQYDEQLKTFTITLVKDSLAQIQKNFQKDKKVVIISAHGNVGLGKSSWINVLIYQASGQKLSRNPFKVTKQIQKTDKNNKTDQTNKTDQADSRTFSLTEGICAYSQPLFWPGQKDTQILLLDCEGFGGIVDGDQRSVEVMLKQMEMIGYLLGSSITIHVKSKVKQEEMNQLKDIFDLFDFFQSDLGIPLPSITLILSKIQNEKEKSDKETTEFLTNEKPDAYSITQQELPKEYIQSEKFKFLDTTQEGQRYLEEQKVFIKKVLENPKMNMITKKELYLDDVIQLMEKISKDINSKDFLEKFYVDFISLINEQSKNQNKQNLFHPVVSQKLEEIDSVLKGTDETNKEENRKNKMIENFQHKMNERHEFEVSFKHNKQSGRGIFGRHWHCAQDTCQFNNKAIFYHSIDDLKNCADKCSKCGETRLSAPKKCYGC